MNESIVFSSCILELISFIDSLLVLSIKKKMEALHLQLPAHQKKESNMTSEQSIWEKCTDSRSWSRMLAIACYPFLQALELEIDASNEFIFSNQCQTAVSSFWVLISSVLYCVIRSSLVCFVWQNHSESRTSPLFLSRLSSVWVSCSDILAGSPVITKPIWQSPVTRMAFQLSSFRWVCEAYPCPANAIFPQLELIQTLSREFEKGPVSVSYTVLLTGVAQATGHTYNLGEAFFCSPVHVTVEEWLPVV